MSTPGELLEALGREARARLRRGRDDATRVYRGRSVEELVPQIQRELGADAIIVRRREGLTGGVLGFFQRAYVEIEAMPGAPGVDVYDEEAGQEPSPAGAGCAAVRAAARAGHRPKALAAAGVLAQRRAGTAPGAGSRDPDTAAFPTARRSPTSPPPQPAPYLQRPGGPATSPIRPSARAGALAHAGAGARTDARRCPRRRRRTGAVLRARARRARASRRQRLRDRPPGGARARRPHETSPARGSVAAPSADPPVGARSSRSCAPRERSPSRSRRRLDARARRQGRGERRRRAARGRARLAGPRTRGRGEEPRALRHRRGAGAELIDGASAHALALAPRAGLAQAVRATLAQRIPVAPPLPTKGAAIVVVGAGGAGKTTCCAALLGAYRKSSSLPASFATITRSPTRPAARQRARRAADAAQPIPDEAHAGALRRVRCARCAGPAATAWRCSTRPASRHPTVRAFASSRSCSAELRPSASSSRCPATLGATAAAQLLQALRPLGANAMAVTHADETDQLGVAVEAACRFGLAPEYMLERGRGGGWRLRQLAPSALAERLLP